MKKESTDEILRYFDKLERAPKEKTMIVFRFENCPLRVCQVRMFLVAIPSISEAQYSQKSVQTTVRIRFEPLFNEYNDVICFQVSPGASRINLKRASRQGAENERASFFSEEENKYRGVHQMRLLHRHSLKH